MEITWSEEWPTEPGDYWFYGWTWLDNTMERNGPPKYHHVQVHVTAGGARVYIARGNFMYKSNLVRNYERHVGVWTPVTFPEPPPPDFIS